MNLGSLKYLTDPSEVVSLFKALPINGRVMSQGVTAAMEATQDGLFKAIKSGKNDDIEAWIVSASKHIDDASDLRFITGNAFKAAIVDSARMDAFTTAFLPAFSKGDAVNLDNLIATHKIHDPAIKASLQAQIATRDSQIAGFAEHFAKRNGGDASQYGDEAKELWASTIGKNSGDAPVPHVTAGPTANVTTPKTTVEQPTPLQEPQANAGGGDDIGGGGKNNGGSTAGGGNEPPDNPFSFASTKLSVPQTSERAFTMPAAKLTADYLNDGHIAEQSWLTRMVSKVIGDGKPYGDYNAEKAKKQIVSGQFDEFSSPANAAHFFHYKVMLSPKNVGTFFRKMSSAFSSTETKINLRHLSLHNVFADTNYARPIIKEVDARMKASGLSEAVYEMQVKMRNLTEEMANNPNMTAQQYKKQMNEIFSSHVATAKFDTSSKQFIRGLDGIIGELQDKLEVITKNKTIKNADGKDVTDKYAAFKSEADAMGKSGLTQYQVKNMIEYYQNIRETAVQISDRNAGFLENYLKHVPEDFTSNGSRTRLADRMRTSLIGYHNEDGAVGGSRLGRIGSEVEQRNTGYNLFKYDDDSIAKLRTWEEKNPNWENLSDAEKLKNPKPELHVEKSRYDEMTRLERLFKQEMASVHDRVSPLTTKGNDNNPEAIFFKLLHEWEHNGGNWDVPKGGDFALRMMSMEKQGYEEQVAELVDMLINTVGANTSAKNTMPIERIKVYIESALKETRDDPLKAEFYQRISNKLERFKQSPMPDGPRDILAEDWMPYYREYYLARAFAANPRQEIVFPGKGAVMNLVDAVSPTAAENLAKTLKVNMPASYPQKYTTAQWATNNLLIRPVSYLFGNKAFKEMVQHGEEMTYKNYYAADRFNWKKLNPLDWSGEAFKPVEGTGFKAKWSNTWGRISNTLDNAPMIFQMPIRTLKGGLDLLGSEGVQKGGVLAYASRAFYATALAGGLAYTGGTALVGEKDTWGNAAAESIDYALTPIRTSVKYGIGYGYAGLVQGFERGAQLTWGVGTGIFSNVIAREGNKYTNFDAYGGLGEKIYQNRDIISDLAGKIRLGEAEPSTQDEPQPQQQSAPQSNTPNLSNSFNSPWTSHQAAPANNSSNISSSYNAQSSSPYSPGATTFNNSSAGTTIPLTVPVITQSSSAPTSEQSRIGVRPFGQ